MADAGEQGSPGEPLPRERPLRADRLARASPETAIVFEDSVTL